MSGKDHFVHRAVRDAKPRELTDRLEHPILDIVSVAQDVEQ